MLFGLGLGIGSTAVLGAAGNSAPAGFALLIGFDGQQLEGFDYIYLYGDV